jgi:hypothetical protein
MDSPDLATFINLYSPVIMGLFFIACIPLLYFLNTDELTLYYFLTIITLVYFILTLQRIYEYKQGFNFGDDEKAVKRFKNSFLYAVGFVLFPLSIRFSSIPLALLGSGILIATAYKNRGENERDNQSEKSKSQEDSQ